MARGKGDPVLLSAGGQDGAPLADVVFIHGLGGDAKGTWGQKPDSEMWWPKWVADDGGRLAVWSLDYDAAPLKWLGMAMPVSDRAGNILARLNADGLGKRPIFLICHSLGGIVAKQMLRIAEGHGERNWQQLGNAVKGVVFIGTPHAGASVANYLYKLSHLARLKPTIAVKELEANAAHLRDLSQWFRNYVHKRNLPVRSFFETQDTWGHRVVDQASADPGLSGSPPIALDGDHLTIAKPPTRDALVHRSVIKFIHDITPCLEALDSELPSASGPIRPPDFHDHNRRTSQFVNDLIHPAAANLRFELRISVARSYTDLMTGTYLHSGLSAAELLKIDFPGPILINAAGGSGKTSFLCAVAQHSIESGSAVFFLQCRDIDLMGDETPPPPVDALFDQFSVSGGYLSFRRFLDNDIPIIVIVDGLNEIIGPQSDIVIESFFHLQRIDPKIRLIIADRLNPRPGIVSHRARIEPLTDDDIQRFWVHSQRDLSTLPRSDIFFSPFFLDILLKLPPTETQREVLKSELLVEYFERVVGLTEAQIDVVSEFAFGVYKTLHGRIFSQTELWEGSTESIRQKLLISGAVIRHPQNKTMTFRHHLLHDYLVGHYLAGQYSHEVPFDILDVASFQANSIEPIAFASEQLKGCINEFVIRLYDWRYRFTIQCIDFVSRVGDSDQIDSDIVVAMLVMNSEKLFDIFDEAAHSALQTLQESRLPHAAEISEIQDFDSLCLFVQGLSPKHPLVKRWKRLFLRPDTAFSSEEGLLLLQEEPLLAWTASNGLRRVDLDREKQAALRMLYLALRSTEGVEAGQVRWRIVHSLGRFPNLVNAELLAKAASSDPHQWCRYGAMRSLMEQCYWEEDAYSQIRSLLMDTITAAPEPLLLRACHNSIRVKDPPTHWNETVHLIADRIIPLIEGRQDLTRWSETFRLLLSH